MALICAAFKPLAAVRPTARFTAGPNPVLKTTAIGAHLLSPAARAWIATFLAAAKRASTSGLVSVMPPEMLHLVLEMLRIGDVGRQAQSAPSQPPMTGAALAEWCGGLHCAFRARGCHHCSSIPCLDVPRIALVDTFERVPFDPRLARVVGMYMAPPLSCTERMAEFIAAKDWESKATRGVHTPIAIPGRAVQLPNGRLLVYDIGCCRIKEVARSNGGGHFRVFATYGNGAGVGDPPEVGPEESHFFKVTQMVLAPCGHCVFIIDRQRDPGTDGECEVAMDMVEEVGFSPLAGVPVRVRVLDLRTGAVRTLRRPGEGAREVAGVLMPTDDQYDWGELATTMEALGPKMVIAGKALHMLSKTKRGAWVAEKHLELDAAAQEGVCVAHAGRIGATPRVGGGDHAGEIVQMRRLSERRIALLMKNAVGMQASLRTLDLDTGAVTSGLPWGAGPPHGFITRSDAGCCMIYGATDFLLDLETETAIVLDREGVLVLAYEGGNLHAKRFRFEIDPKIGMWYPYALFAESNGSVIISYFGSVLG